MKHQVKQQNLALFASLLLLLVIVGAFFLLWRSAKPAESSVVLEEKYETVEIASVKESAQKLLQAKGNLTQMPIKAPIENIGRENPFAGVQ